MKYLLAAILIFSPAIGMAAVGDLQVPQPIQDLWQTFSQIHVDVGQNQAAQQIGQDIQNTVSEAAQNPQNWLSEARNWWGAVNTWFQDHIGVKFSQILTVMGNLFIWVFELMIKLIKLALPVIQ